MTDPLIEMAAQHEAVDQTCRAALRASARLVERLRTDPSPDRRDVGAELAEIIFPALVIAGEMHP